MRSFRTTITIPQDLKERMDALEVEVNWSAVAARAFEEKLAEIGSNKERQVMSDFIRAFGPDPHNSQMKSHQHIHRETIRKVVPVYAVEKDGKFFDCTPNLPGAKLMFYRLFDKDGQEYSCVHRSEFERLGLVSFVTKGETAMAKPMCRQCGKAATHYTAPRIDTTNFESGGVEESIEGIRTPYCKNCAPRGAKRLPETEER
jgi:hypothetical protein